MSKLEEYVVPAKMIMANHPNSVAIAKNRIRQSVYYCVNGETPFFVLASIVSSPRLFDVFLKDICPTTFTEAGDTFLSRHTMLADNCEMSYAISLAQWSDIAGRYTEVDQYEKGDTSISKIQVWPFDPRLLSFEQMVLSVGMSYSDEDLKDEPRLCGALRNLMKDYKIEYYWEPRKYG